MERNIPLSLIHDVMLSNGMKIEPPSFTIRKAYFRKKNAEISREKREKREERYIQN